MSKFNFNIDIDNSEQNLLSKSKYNSISQKKLYEINQYIVDLGLPSGTRWCKYNLGVNTNQLYTTEDWYGDKYAWGETKPKIVYTWDAYTMSDEKDDFECMKKYTTNATDAFYDQPDYIKELLPEDDAAYQNLHIFNFNFYMPTIEQVIELQENTKFSWSRVYNDVIGLEGGVFTSKINGNHIFIPACGEQDLEEQYSGMNIGCIWTSSLNISNNAWAYKLFFRAYECYKTTEDRCNGCSIRPVINENQLFNNYE